MPDTLNKILWSEDEETETIYLTTPYDERFVTYLKQRVPYEERDPRAMRGRGWNPPEGSISGYWGVYSEALDDLLEFAQQIWPRLEVEEE
jgi:hypothetical protein